MCICVRSLGRIEPSCGVGHDAVPVMYIVVKQVVKLFWIGTRAPMRHLLAR